MKAVIIGGCGHIGSYLAPTLVGAGFHTVCVSRGKNKPYTTDRYWNQVEHVILDRTGDSDFEKKIAALNADIVVDLICFDVPGVRKITQALGGTNLSHYLFCSSIWTHGAATTLPATEDLPKYPLDEYGRDKAACDEYLHTLYRQEGFPETTVMPGQISGPGWNIINPVGNLDPMVFQRIGRGEEIALPNFGMETLHHVHADDVAQVFFNAITHRSQALGESFHAVSAQSITLMGYAQAMYRWFGKEPKIKLLPWDRWREYTGNEDDCNQSYYHLARSGSFSIEKARRLIEYAPRHTVLEAIQESVASMIERKAIVL